MKKRNTQKTDTSKNPDKILKRDESNLRSRKIGHNLWVLVTPEKDTEEYLHKKALKLCK